MDSNKIMWNIDHLFKIYISHQCHHCTHRRVCHSAARSVGGWQRCLMIPGKTNSKPNTARRAPAQSSHECVGRRSTPLNRDGVVTAASQRHRPADPVWACQLNDGDGSPGQSKNTGMIYSKRYNKTCFNSSLPGQKGHNFTDDFFKWINVNEEFHTLI